MTNNRAEGFILKAKKLHGNKYDYSNIEYKNRQTKVCIICPEHGEFWQTPGNHLEGKGCPKCGHMKAGKNRALNSEVFIEKAKEIHGDKYDYSKVEYINSRIKVCIICPEHGEFWMTPSAHLSGQKCKYCSGVVLNTDIFIEKARKVNGDKYDYSKVEYINNRVKVCIICPEHGEFWQKPILHLRGCQCPKCTGEYRYSNEEWIEKAKQVHGEKYDYSNTEFVGVRTKVNVICPKHGEFSIYPNNHLNGLGCPKCKVSKLERMIMDLLKEKGVEFTYNKRFEWLRNQKPMPLDFYLPEYNVAIECQGEQHLVNGRQFENVNKNYVTKNDWLKNMLCEENGIKVFYFGEVELEAIDLNKNLYNSQNYYLNRHLLLKKIMNK